MPLAPDPYARNFYLKSVMEETFGKRAWYDLKETTDERIWKKYFEKSLKSFEVAIKETVKIKDDEWLEGVLLNISDGIARIKQVTTFDEALSIFCATLLRQSYLQMGSIPRRRTTGSDKCVTLHGVNWKLDGFRSVQYVQSSEQRANLFLSKLQKEVGFEEEMRLFREYQDSGSACSFEKWYFDQVASQ